MTSQLYDITLAGCPWRLERRFLQFSKRVGAEYLGRFDTLKSDAHSYVLGLLERPGGERELVLGRLCLDSGMVVGQTAGGRNGSAD